jgi:hypothetical protein
MSRTTAALHADFGVCWIIRFRGLWQRQKIAIIYGHWGVILECWGINLMEAGREKVKHASLAKEKRQCSPKP